MLTVILSCFMQVINAFRSIYISFGDNINLSLFTLLAGIFIFAVLCRTYLKYILDLPVNLKVPYSWGKDYSDTVTVIDKEITRYKNIPKRVNSSLPDNFDDFYDN